MADAARIFSKRVAPDESRVVEAKYKAIKDLHSLSLEMSKLFRARNSDDCRVSVVLHVFHLRSPNARKREGREG